MKKIKYLVLAFIFGILISTTNVYAKNEVKLNFDGATVDEDNKAFSYPGLGKVLVFKDDEAITVSNGMTIDLDEAKYELQIIGYIYTEKLNEYVLAIINDWYYGLKNNQEIIVLDTNKYSGNINIKLKLHVGVAINTRVENIYTDTSSTQTIDLSKEYVIDFTKEDELTSALKLFADLEKTLYYKNENGSLILTENIDEAIIKIVGYKDKNIAVMSAINVNGKETEKLSGLFTKYTGSKLQYDSSYSNVINETRSDYYTKLKYDYTFDYIGEHYTVIKGANQKYVVSKNKLLTFTINADYSLFGKVYIDDKLVDSSNYTSKSGSTIITFNYDFIKSLSTGSHSLKVVFDNQKEAVTTFTLSSEIINPQTYDNGIILYAIFGIISLIVVSLSIKKLLLNK